MDAKLPNEVKISEINAACGRAVYRSFMAGIEMRDASIQFVVKGDYTVGDRVEYCHGITGVVEMVFEWQGEKHARTLINCCEFRDLWLQLTIDQQFEE